MKVIEVFADLDAGEVTHIEICDELLDKGSLMKMDIYSDTIGLLQEWYEDQQELFKVEAEFIQKTKNE